jgi:hypothetical protein
MFGTHAHNPLYSLVGSTATFAWVLFALALAFTVALLGRHQVFIRVSKLSGLMAVSMLIVAVDLSRVNSTPPLYVTVEPDPLSFSATDEAYPATIFAHAWDTSIVLALGVVGLLCWYAFKAITGRHTLTFGGLVVLLLGAIAVALQTIESQFNNSYTGWSSRAVIDSYSGWSSLAVIDARTWDVLAVAIVAYTLLVVVVMTRCGTRRLKARRTAVTKMATSNEPVSA